MTWINSERYFQDERVRKICANGEKGFVCLFVCICDPLIECESKFIPVCLSEEIEHGFRGVSSDLLKINIIKLIWIIKVREYLTYCQ